MEPVPFAVDYDERVMVIQIQIAVFIAFAAILLYAAAEDIRTRQIPNTVHILLLLVGCCNLFDTGPPLLLHKALLAVGGLLVGGLPLLLLALLRPRSVGGGDVKLVGSAGFVLGFLDSYIALLVSLILFLLAALLRKIILKGREHIGAYEKGKTQEDAYAVCTVLRGRRHRRIFIKNLEVNMNAGFLKSKAVISTGCIVAALLVGFVGVPLVNNLSSETVPTVRAKTDIKAGTKITPGMLETVKLNRENLGNVTDNINDVAGAYATVEIQPHDIITGAKLSHHWQTGNLADGQMLLSVTIKNFADGLSGKLQPGDIVSVYIPQQNTGTSGNNYAADNANNSDADSASNADIAKEAKAVNPKELQYVKVAAVTASNGVDTDKAKTGASSQDSSSLPATVTLVVTKQQAAVLAGVNQNEVQFALVYRGGGKKAQDFLNKQTDMLNQGVQ